MKERLAEERNLQMTCVNRIRNARYKMVESVCDISKEAKRLTIN